MAWDGGANASVLDAFDTITAFPQVATFQSDVGAQDVNTSEFVHTYTDITGLTDIPCRIGPLVIDRPSAEISRLETTEVRYKDLHMLLRGYFPAVNKTMYVVIDSTYRYRVDNVQHDGNHITTRLRITSATSVDAD